MNKTIQYFGKATLSTFRTIEESFCTSSLKNFSYHHFQSGIYIRLDRPQSKVPYI